MAGTSSGRMREVILAPTGSVVAPGVNLYGNLDGVMDSLNPVINVGDIAFFNYKTGVTVAPGVTSDTVEKLGVAVAIDSNRDGIPNRLRFGYGNYIDSCAVDNVRSKGGNCGCNEVMDFVADCTFQDEAYTIEIHTRGNREVYGTQHWNQWDRQSFTVNLKELSCDTCENGIDTKEVFCALKNKINAHTRKRSPQFHGNMVKKRMMNLAKERMWTAYVLHPIDKVYAIQMQDGIDPCESCTFFSGVKSITIDEGDPVVFPGMVNAQGLTPKAKEERLIKLINKAFENAGVEGSAVVDKQLTGSGAPCCDFKIRINSCVEFSLQDFEDNDIEPIEESNPLIEAIQNPANCVGCTEGKSWTPTSGLRVVAHAQEITCDCNDPVDRAYWFHREVKISVSNQHNWTRYAIRQVQAPVIPTNLGVQIRKRILDMDSGGPGQDYDNWVIDKTGVYMRDRNGTAWTESFRGLDCQDMFCGVSIEHSLRFDDNSVNGNINRAKGRTQLFINNKDTALYAAIKAILDPWLASTSCSNVQALSCGNGS